MKKEIIYSSGNYLRDEFKIEGYLFGKQSEGSEPAACIVGAMRGNEYQQLYICSQLVKRLKELENSGAIVGDNQILVIPCVNNFSMNVGMKYWVSDNSDINRQFPGNFDGEPTSRLAAHLNGLKDSAMESILHHFSEAGILCHMCECLQQEKKAPALQVCSGCLMY